MLGVPAIAGSASLAIDATSLYWADPDRHAILRAPRGGGAPVELAPADPALYAPVVVTETDVLWVDDAALVSVWRVPLSGGVRTRVAVGHGGPIGLGADREHAFFSGTDSGFELVDVTLATGAVRVLDPDLPALAVVAVGRDLYGTSCGVVGGVWRIGRDGGARTPLVSRTFCPITLAVDEAHVYWQDYVELMASPGGSAIYRAPRGGGDPERVVVNGGLAFAVHRGSVYTFRGGTIVRADERGEAPVAPCAEDVRGIAVDDDFVYWTEADERGALALHLAPRPG